jgi:hypothetical protein
VDRAPAVVLLILVNFACRFGLPLGLNLVEVVARDIDSLLGELQSIPVRPQPARAGLHLADRTPGSDRRPSDWGGRAGGHVDPGPLDGR